MIHLAGGRRWLAAGAVLLALIPPPALAHPHVWVLVETTAIYAGASLTALRHRWAFDELYTAMAIQGLDANADGKVDRAELAELAKVNVEGLKDFNYFTTVKIGDQPLAFDAPTDVLMEHGEVDRVPGRAADPDKQAATPGKAGETGGFWSRLTRSMAGATDAQREKPKVLALEFTLPLKQPVLAGGDAVTFSVSDPSFFIWFDFVNDKPVRLAEGAHAGCKAEVGLPAKDGAQLQQLGEAFFNQAGGANIGFGVAKTVTLSCPK